MAAVWFRPPPTSGPFARDFEAYYSAGATRNAGGDPYGRAIWDRERTIPGVDATHDEVLPFVGPPFALPLWSALARLPFSRARTIWESALVAAAALLVVASLFLAGGGLGARLPAALALAAAGGPFISAFALGQAALAGAAGTVAAFLALERRPNAAVPAALIAALQPNLALPLAVRLGDPRSLVRLAIAAVAFVAIGVASGGDLRGYVDLLRRHGAAERASVIQHTVPAIVASFGAASGAVAIAGVASALLAVALIALAAIRLRAQPTLAAAVAVALLPFAVPFFHEHDFTIELFPLLIVLVRGDARSRALGGVAAVAVLVDWLGCAQRSAPLQTLALALTVAAAAALCALRETDDARAMRLVVIAPVAGALALCAFALPLAHAFPVPTWPDALGAFRMPPGAGIAATWGEELRRSGLDDAVAAWGLLRAIPLAGCALAAVACARLARSAYAMNTAPSRTSSATPVSDSPIHGPSVQ